MKKPIYSIYDSVAGFYCPIFICENDNHAIRMMAQSIDYNHRSDYSLWCLGTFDSQNGLVDTHEPKMTLSGQSLPKKETE